MSINITNSGHAISQAENRIKELKRVGLLMYHSIVYRDKSKQTLAQRNATEQWEKITE